MTVNKTVTHYSRNVHGQPNRNLRDYKQRVDWEDTNKASSKDYISVPKGSGTSVYDINKKDYRKPFVLNAMDFGFNIPDCAYISKITFTARLKISGKIKVYAPYATFNFYNGKNDVPTYKVDDTGWENNVYHYNPKKKLSNSWQDITYVMTGKEFRKKGYPISEINELSMGIDIRFYDAVKPHSDSHTVSVQWVKCTVEYELPDHSITFDTITSEDNPRVTTAGQPYDIVATYKNKSNAGCCNGIPRQITVTPPRNAFVSVLNGNYANGIWTVQCKPNATETLKLRITNYGIGEEPINFTNSDIGNYNYWTYSTPADHDIGTVAPYPKIMQRGVISCVEFHSRVNAHDGEIDFTVNLDTAHNSAENIIWTVSDLTSKEVSYDVTEFTDTHLHFTTPPDTVVDIIFTGCFIPSFDGDSAVSVQLSDNEPVLAPYTCLEAPTFIVRNNPITDDNNREVSEITLNPDVILFGTHRVATSTEIEAYIIDCSVAPFDATMIEDDCTLTASIWEKINYIGCVPLPFSHFDPKSTYQNKEINESYKNKTYMGKEGIIDEDITLNFRVPPKDVTTLQGLVKLDKPTPINANWRCFEGDVLNHRGWVVFSKIQAEKTNPLYYKCEATVTYITHDINTKFQIFKELQVNNVAMPDILADTFELGSNLSTGLDVFDIDTDGGFIYDEDSEEGAKNLFSLDELQHLSIKTINQLADVSKIRFDWYSNKINETRENNIERIFRLLDKDGNSVFEYEYTDFSFVENFVTCTVIIRVKNDVGGWDNTILEGVELKTEIEADPIADIDIDTSYDGEEGEEDEDDLTDDAYEEGYIAPNFNPEEYDISLIYGTSLEFEINRNKITVHDAGYNGREVSETFELIGNNYAFETYWLNNNQDGMTEDLISYIDIALSETVLNTTYSEYYKDLIVSPFPIPYKKVVFTRESEEGTIFYLTGEEPFKYRIEPFYQYHVGCDLTTREGISIFDLNNSYTHFYIENGLVRLGFNKFNGRLYLAKWDIISKEWITTHYFHMADDTKFALEKISDDKIIIKAGNNTFFSIWRGHPYIAVTNPTDEIFIDTNFNYAYSDKVEGVSYDFPLIHTFMNIDNLLPFCIGGTTLDEDCITVDDDDISIVTDHDIEVDLGDTIIAGEETVLGATLSPTTSDGKVHYLINGVEVGEAETPFNFPYTFEEEGVYTVQAVYTGDEDDNIAISEPVTVIVKTPEPRPNSSAAQTTVAGTYNLKIISAPSKFTYLDGKEVVLQLRKGQTPMPRKVIEVQKPDGTTASHYTDSNGKYAVKNTNPNYLPRNVQWGARFYDEIDEDMDRKFLCKALRWIEIEKAKPTFTHNDADGKVSKGKYLTVKLSGVEGGLKNKKITYTLNGGSKKSKTTNSGGKIAIPFNKKGTFKVKVMFAGDTKYKSVSKTFTIKVV